LQENARKEGKSERGKNVIEKKKLGKGQISCSLQDVKGTGKKGKRGRNKKNETTSNWDNCKRGGHSKQTGRTKENFPGVKVWVKVKKKRGKEKKKRGGQKKKTNQREDVKRAKT